MTIFIHENGVDRVDMRKMRASLVRTSAAAQRAAWLGRPFGHRMSTSATDSWLGGPFRHRMRTIVQAPLLPGSKAPLGTGCAHALLLYDLGPPLGTGCAQLCKRHCPLAREPL